MFDGPPLDGVSFRELADLYCAFRNPSQSMQNQIHLVVRLLNKDLGVTRPDELSVKTLLIWRETVSTRASAQTWNNYRRHLKVLLRFGVAQRVLSRDPLTLPAAPVGEPLPKTVEIEHISMAIAALRSKAPPVEPGWFWAITLHTLYGTGIRHRQLINARWPHVNFGDEGSIRDPRLLLSVDGSKTRREWWIPLPLEVASDLVELRERTVQRAGNDYLRNGQVFNVTLWSKSQHTTMNYWHTHSMFRRLRKHLSIPRFSAHKIRHTFGTQAGKHRDLKSLQVHMGHTSVKTTLQYIHPDMEQLRDMVSTLPRVLPP